MPPPRLAPAAVPAVRQARGFHRAVAEFKRQLIEVTLRRVGGNRTLAADVLGLQRTYLLRLMRRLGVAVPPPGRRGRILGAG